jgi:hypothetical protein
MKGEGANARISEPSMGARNRAGIGLSYIVHRLEVSIPPWNPFLGSLKVKKFGLRTYICL